MFEPLDPEYCVDCGHNHAGPCADDAASDAVEEDEDDSGCGTCASCGEEDVELDGLDECEDCAACPGRESGGCENGCENCDDLLGNASRESIARGLLREHGETR